MAHQVTRHMGVTPGFHGTLRSNKLIRSTFLSHKIKNDLIFNTTGKRSIEF